MLDKGKIKRILVITLSNIGDVVLTTPVLDALRRNFSSSKIDVLVGPRACELFQNDPRIGDAIIYDKQKPLSKKVELVFMLRKKHYDLVVDLRNTLMPLFLGPRYRTKLVSEKLKGVIHKKDLHLKRLEGLFIDTHNANFDIWVNKSDEDYVDKVLSGIDERLCAVAAGARSETKRWEVDKFSVFCKRLIDNGRNVILVGDVADGNVAGTIVANDGRILNLCGKTTLPQLAAILKRCELVISNDSAVMHIATAVKTPVVAIFGPTDPAKYRPTGKDDVVVRKELSCSPCEKAQCSRNRECLELITVDEVYQAVVEILSKAESTINPKFEYRNTKQIRNSNIETNCFEF